MKTLANIFTAITILVATNTFSNPNNILKNGLYFQIKLENTTQDAIMPLQSQFNYFDIEHTENSEAVTCYAGIFKTKKEATIAENTLRFKGYNNATTVAFFNEQEITAEEAIALLSNQNSIDLASDAINLNKMEVMINAAQNPETFHYAVQVWVTNFTQAEQLIEYTYQNSSAVSKLQGGNYAIGKFKSIEAAKEAWAEMQESGIEQTHITAYYNQQQMSAIAAKELESYFEGSVAVK